MVWVLEEEVQSTLCCVRGRPFHFSTGGRERYVNGQGLGRKISNKRSELTLLLLDGGGYTLWYA